MENVADGINSIVKEGSTSLSEEKGILITTLRMTTRFKREIYRSIFDGSAVFHYERVEIIIQEVSLILPSLEVALSRHTYFAHATGYPVTYTIYVIRLFTRSYIFLVFVTYDFNIERSNNDSALATVIDERVINYNFQ